MKQCQYCGHMVADDALYCSSCGRTLNMPPRYAPGDQYGQNQFNSRSEWAARNNAFDADPVSGRSRGIAALLAFFLGAIGVQYFYLGKTTAGLLTILLSIVTCGVWDIVIFIQAIMLLLMSNAEFARKYIDSNSTMPLF